MDCIIIDDELAARIIIEQLAKNNPSVNVLKSFSSAIDAIKFLNDNEVDLIFLDIHMPTFNGFDFIKTLHTPPKIILTTSDRNFAIEAFEYHCIVDYFVKPVVQERFDNGVQKALSFAKDAKSSPKNDPQPSNNDLYINMDRRLIKIDIPTILVVEAKGDYILLKTEQESYRVHSTLRKIEEKLPEDTFLKVHRSYVINTKKIIDIEDNSVLIDKQVIPVSRSNRKELMKRLNLL